MKRANNLIAAAADLNNLYKAFWKASKGKRYNVETILYQQDLEANLLKLRAEILSGHIQVGDYQYFTIHDPKEREICAAAFREQVLHHALMNVCHDRFESTQIFDSYASRLGKGTHAAVRRAQMYSQKYEYYLKLDVKKFFASLSHEVLRQQLRELFKEVAFLQLFDQIISSYETMPTCGVPIGNLTSQYMANHYLNGLDRYVKAQLKTKGYVRYMDDMVLWDDEKIRLQQAAKAIIEYVSLILKMGMKPIVLHKTQIGLSFLGYQILPYQIKLSQRSKKRYFTKMNWLNQQWNQGLLAEMECQQKARSLLAFIETADTQHLKIQFNQRLSF
jgi:RNA-directed DNA polymerase